MFYNTFFRQKHIGMLKNSLLLQDKSVQYGI